MYRILGIILTAFILSTSIGCCEEAAYSFGESGAVRLDQYSLAELNGSEIVTFSVTTGSDVSGGTVCPNGQSISDIKNEIENRVEVGNQKVVDEATFLAAKYPGDHSVEQVCAIFDYLKHNWNYTGDPRCKEYYRYASETILLGERIGRAGAGDCDDFAILMSALIENIGGTTRINLAYDESQGHAYTEVCIGQINNKDNYVNKTTSWLRNEYKIDNIFVHIDEDTNYVWLNLDWWADHPGGPFYKYDTHKKLVPIRPDLPIYPLNPPNIPPLAIISYAPEKPNARKTMTFDASRSLDPYGQITKYEWDFGDGKPENGSDPISNHTFQTGGTKTVILTVTDDKSETNSSTCVIEVNEPPVAEFKCTSIEKTGSHYIMNLDASESHDEEDGDVSYYEWSFGEKQSTEEGPDLIQTSHIYSKSSTFNVTLTVKDSNEAEGFKSELIKINKPPIAKFSADKSEVNIGDEIYFDASDSSDRDGNITECRWDFGDEQTAEGDSLSHNYLTYGNFTVKLVVKDDDNATNSTESLIHVNKPPRASFMYTPEEPVLGDLINFISNSSDEDGYIPDSNYEWDFENGIQRKGVSEVYDFDYSRAGIHTVILKVTDDKGAVDEFTAQVIVKEKSSNSPPNVIDIIPSPPSPQTVGNTVKFYAYASDPEEDQILYKFYLKGPASVWQPVGDWINANWWEWTPVEPGDYEIQVWIRDGNHATSDGQDAYKMIPYKINPLPNLPNQRPTIMALTPNKPSPQVSGTAIEWTATASDPEKDTIFYRFDLLNSENLSIEGDWSTSSVWTWYSSASEEGLYGVCVYVKDGKHESHYGYDSYKCYYGFSLLMGPAGDLGLLNYIVDRNYIVDGMV